VIRCDRWLRGQVLVVAAAVALQVATLSRPGWQVPVTIVCFAVTASPIVVPLALLPLVFRDRAGFRVAGLVAGVAWRWSTSASPWRPRC
jgi:hypothetical protein